MGNSNLKHKIDINASEFTRQSRDFDSFKNKLLISVISIQVFFRENEKNPMHSMLKSP